MTAKRQTQLPIWNPAGYSEAERVRAVIPHCVGVFRRRVPGGRLDVILSFHPDRTGWHLSIAHKASSNAPERLPTWEEIADARYQLIPNDRHMVMHLPPREEYVNLHPTAMHLYESHERQP